MFNYNSTFSESNTIACRHNGTEIEVSGSGTYNGKAYSRTVEPLYRFEDMTLRRVSDSNGERFEVLFEDEVYNRSASLKVALSYFKDFSGLDKRQLEKVKVKTAA